MADELADGAKGAALPLIRHDLGLSYTQVGLLASVPLVAGGVLELPLGILAGEGRRRRVAVLCGGLVFIVSLLAVAAARSFIVLLAAFTVFFPASGAFVSLTQAELMDAWPERQAQVMARWDLAGSTGSVAGPLLLTAVLAAGGGWRAVYLALAALAAVTWLGTWRFEPRPVRAATAGSGGGPGPGGGPGSGVRWAARAREVVGAMRDWSTVRWVVLIEVADLLVDVLTGFLALYLVDVAHLAPPIAALAIAIRFGSGLAADVALVAVLDRVTDVTVLRVSAVAAGLLYPGFLLAPGPVAKLVILALLSAATAPWYPLLQARLYGSLPGRSPVAVTLSSAAGLAAGLGPLAVGLVAEAFGLTWALAVLVVVPAVMLAGSAAARPGGADRAGGPGGPGGPDRAGQGRDRRPDPPDGRPARPDGRRPGRRTRRAPFGGVAGPHPGSARRDRAGGRRARPGRGEHPAEPSAIPTRPPACATGSTRWSGPLQTDRLRNELQPRHPTPADVPPRPLRMLHHPSRTAPPRRGYRTVALRSRAGRTAARVRARLRA